MTYYCKCHFQIYNKYTCSKLVHSQSILMQNNLITMPIIGALPTHGITPLPLSIPNTQYADKAVASEPGHTTHLIFLMLTMFQWKEDVLLFVKILQAISRTTRPNIGLYVLLLMHFPC